MQHDHSLNEPDPSINNPNSNSLITHETNLTPIHRDILYYITIWMKVLTNTHKHVLLKPELSF